MLDLAIVTDELLVGTEIRSSEDLATLKSLGVGAILSLQEPRDYRVAGTRFDTLRQVAFDNGMEMRLCAVRDFDPASLLQKLERCVEELDELVQNHHRVYVHCTAGINRSPGVVLAYLVIKKGMAVPQAYRLLKTRRPQANPYRALLDSLAGRTQFNHFDGQ